MCFKYAKYAMEENVYVKTEVAMILKEYIFFNIIAQ